MKTISTFELLLKSHDYTPANPIIIEESLLEDHYIYYLDIPVPTTKKAGTVYLYRKDGGVKSAINHLLTSMTSFIASSDSIIDKNTKGSMADFEKYSTKAHELLLDKIYEVIPTTRLNKINALQDALKKFNKKGKA